MSKPDQYTLDVIGYFYRIAYELALNGFRNSSSIELYCNKMLSSLAKVGDEERKHYLEPRVEKILDMVRTKKNGNYTSEWCLDEYVRGMKSFHIL